MSPSVEARRLTSRSADEPLAVAPDHVELLNAIRAIDCMNALKARGPSRAAQGGVELEVVGAALALEGRGGRRAGNRSAAPDRARRSVVSPASLDDVAQAERRVQRSHARSADLGEVWWDGGEEAGRAVPVVRRARREKTPAESDEAAATVGGRPDAISSFSGRGLLHDRLGSAWAARSRRRASRGCPPGGGVEPRMSRRSARTNAAEVRGRRA